MTITDEVVEQTTLEIKEGSRDAVYTLTLIRDTQYADPNYGFHLQALFGRRGSTMQEKRWPETLPLTKDKARKEYQDKIAEKVVKKGYKIVASDAPKEKWVINPSPVVPLTEAGLASLETSKWLPIAKLPPHQLLNAVDNPQFYVDSPVWWMQRKEDGVRAYLIRDGMDIRGQSRTGLPVTVHDDVKLAALKLKAQRFVLDGEMCGPTFYTFDMLHRDAFDYRATDYAKRFTELGKLVPLATYGAIQVSATWRTPKEKRPMFEELRQRGSEGVVFKEPKATYQSGRPNTGGCALKHKFKAQATVQVVPKVKEDGKSSVEMAVLGPQGLQRIGTVTVPPNKTMPKVGDMIEVEYLYAYRGGSMVQAVLLRQREDKLRPDRLETLQFKEEPRPAAKEPWQMTSTEYLNSIGVIAGRQAVQDAHDQHSRLVYAAVQESKPVPPEVLEEYPGAAAKEYGSWKEAADANLAERPPMGQKKPKRLCSTCGQQLETDAKNKLPHHFAIGKLVCPASGTDQHLFITEAAPFEDPEAQAIVDSLKEHWQGSATAQLSKPLCLCGHPELRHRKKGPHGSGYCMSCVCEVYEPDEDGQPAAPQASQPHHRPASRTAQASQPHHRPASRTTGQPAAPQASQPHGTGQPAAPQASQPHGTGQPAAPQASQPHGTGQPAAPQASQPHGTGQPAAPQATFYQTSLF